MSAALLKKLGVKLAQHAGKNLAVHSPVDGKKLASLKTDTPASLKTKLKNTEKAFVLWAEVPAPKRGELIRLFGEELRTHKNDLATLVTLECGKIRAEALGEVQEMIDICDFAVGLSRQLCGLTIASERAQHVLQENWLPLGPVGVISAFNFPVAVWAWNFALAVVCGDSVVWKPSEKTPLTALASQALFEKAAARAGKDGLKIPANISQIVLGDAKIGEALAQSPALKLISATGSVRMGRAVAPQVAERFGKALLELGGNNAIIVSDKADINLALDAILFGAVGTAGQRCTTTRRLFVQKKIHAKVLAALKKRYAVVARKIGSPLQPGTLIGPLIDKASFTAMQNALQRAKKEGGQVFFGKRALEKKYPKAFYVEPALVSLPRQTAVVTQETFAPILYVMPYTTLDQAIALNNAVPQGLSSSLFTTDVREAELFKQRSDCGIANVNIGTSGAEIGGAFGGEKETGGGRESGSDSWKNYMRRQTSTTFYGRTAPELAQGITFKTK